MSSAGLKRPTGVYLLAILFLLAPIGNILISFAGSGVDNWYDPGVFSPFLMSIPAVDWVWLGFLFVTGILLFFPHKLSWSIAIFTLFVVLGVNAYRLYSIDTNSIDPGFLKVFSVLAILCTLSVLVIALYFRFPYLDRRANWFTKEERFDIKTDVSVNDIRGVTQSISYTGCKITFNESVQFTKGQKVKVVLSEILQIPIESEVAEVLELGARVEFIKLSFEAKQALGQWLKSQS